MTQTTTESIERGSAADAAPAKEAARRSRAMRGPFLQRYALVLLFAAVGLFFAVRLPDSFATVLNFRNIVGNQSVLAIVSIAAILPLIGGQFDLSIGSVLGLSTIATASALSRFSAPIWVAALVGIGIGAAVGGFNGFVIAKLGVNALITTLGVATVITGLISLYTNGLSILSGIPESLTNLGSGTWLGLPRTLYALAAVAVFAWYLLEHTPFGRYLHAVGSNPNAARLVGIDVDGIVIRSFVISGALIGFGGVLEVARQGGGNPQTGNFFLMPALSAAFLGATSIHPGRFNVPGTIVSVFFLATTVSGLALSGVDNWVESVFNGAALAIAVGLSTYLGRRQAG